MLHKYNSKYEFKGEPQMKTLSILAALLLGASVNFSAHAEQPQGLYIADAESVTESTNNATRLKFNSRRGYRNPAVHNKDRYKADDAWEGTAYIEEQEAKEAQASKRLNRQFRSKRPHIDYQFD